MKKNLVNLKYKVRMDCIQAKFDYQTTYDTAYLNADANIDGKITENIRKSYANEQSKTEKQKFKKQEALLEKLDLMIELVDDFLVYVI